MCIRDWFVYLTYYMKDEMKYFHKMQGLSDEELQNEYINQINSDKPYCIVKSLIIQQVQRERA